MTGNSKRPISSIVSNLQPYTPYNREALVNFWADLPSAAKKALLRIDEDAYITALECFLSRHSLCCECHDNVIAEWEDHKKQKSGLRSLRHVFKVENTSGNDSAAPQKAHVVIREDNTDFILDLIHCGEEFSYVTPYRPLFGDDDSDGDGECPGANTSHLAQEYLLEVLSNKFREQIGSAYQIALQKSLNIQAQLLEDELANMQIAEAKAALRRRKKKEKKMKRKKKILSSDLLPILRSTTGNENQAMDKYYRKEKTEVIDSKEKNETESIVEDQIDREVEDFRILLEQISRNGQKSRKKLVLPAGTFHQQSAYRQLNFAPLQAV